MTTIARFKDDHDKLRELADRLELHLDAPAPPLGQDFAQLRWMLVRELSLHLAIERRTIEDWRTRTRARIETQDYALEEAFMQHLVDWSGATVSAAWDRYRAEMRRLLDRLRARMTAEETKLFPKLAVAAG